MTSTISATLVLLAGLLITFCLKLYKQRRLMKGLPMPPHHPLLGHLPIFAKIVRSLPPDIHPHCYPYYIRQAYDLGPIFYLDTWPLGDPMLIIAGDPAAAHEVTVTHSLPKHWSLGAFLTPLGGRKNLVSMEGREWKAWRSIFNPGFAPGNLMGLVPSVVEEVEVFARVLGEWADGGEVVVLEEVATRVTVDVIGRVVLDTKFNSQTSDNELVSAMRSQVRWSWPTDMYAPIRNLNPLRPFVFWWNTRTMNRYLERELEKRFEGKSGGDMKKRKHVIDLALETYINEQSPEKKGSGFDDTFKKMAINQIKTFIFAGHDTSSSTICWIYHTLSQHPTALAQLRHEHDTVFGTDLSLAPQLLKSTPHLLNKLPYTLAVIKEVLRLYPPASSVRGGEKNYSIHNTYPTHSCLVWPQLYALNRDPAFFPSPNLFLPERFLPPPPPPPPDAKPDSSQPNGNDKQQKQHQKLTTFPPAAFRPFEHGPRNCIGQDLALLEIKIVLVLTVRAFDVRAAYEELDAREGKRAEKGEQGKEGEQGNEWGGKGKKEIRDVEGERAYQILWATAKPKGGLPGRVVRTGRR